MNLVAKSNTLIKIIKSNVTPKAVNHKILVATSSDAGWGNDAWGTGEWGGSAGTVGVEQVRAVLSRMTPKTVLSAKINRVTTLRIGSAGDTDMTYIYLKALAQASGNLMLSDATNWDTSKSIIKYISVKTVSTDWTLTLYPDADFDENGAFPSLLLASNRNGNLTLHLDLPYIDTTSLKKVYLTFTDNAGTDTADIYLLGVEAK